MILYQLRCSDDHRFEAWFRDSSAYDEQEKKTQISCPVCGDAHIAKAPMAPNISSPKSGSGPKAGSGDARARAVAERILKDVGRIRKHVEENCDYVGDKFAEEARRIHYGDSEDRGIYGEASREEADDLAAEDIEVWPLPLAKRRDS